MLRIGINNYVGAANVSATSTAAGRTPQMVQDATITHWQAGANDATLSIVLSDAGISEIIVSGGDCFIDMNDGYICGGNSQSVDLITAHRVQFTGLLTVNTYYGGALQGANSYNPGDLDGIEVLHLFTTLSGICDRVDFVFSGGNSAPSIGYIWVGSQITFGTAALQDFDESFDTAAVSQAGFAGSRRKNLLRTLQVTASHTEARVLKGYMRQIMRSGYAVPRPFVRTETCLPTETLLGILDAPRIGYDFFENIDTATGYRKAQTTFGIAEVLGAF